MDLPRHIRENLPFAGKVAYASREHTYDNGITELIRHTIEYLKEERKRYHAALFSGPYAEEAGRIRHATPGYSKGERRKVILDNLNPLTHPYYYAYRDLQRLCLKILRREELKYGSEEEELHGILFDGAWLWESYLAVVLKPLFRHYHRGDGRRRDRLFADEDGDSFQVIIPDFLSKEGAIVADAKYIPLDKEYRNLRGIRASEVYYKTLMYMLRYGSESGALIYPVKAASLRKQPLRILETGKKLILVGVPIPTGSPHDYKTFALEMAKAEGQLIEALKAEF